MEKTYTYAVYIFLTNIHDFCRGSETLKGLLHCFLTCIKITGTNSYCFNLKNVENCKENSKGLKSYKESKF